MGDKSSNPKNEITLRKVIDLKINFPEPSKSLSENENNLIRNSIKENGSYDAKTSETFINKKALKNILHTDQEGVKKFYNDLNNSDKREYSSDRFASTSSLKKELNERIQQPRDIVQREKYRESERCLDAMRDSPELEKIRGIEESRIRRQLPKLKDKKQKSERIMNCQISGQPIENAEAHHIIRKADDPRQATNLDNIAIVNENVHTRIHQEGASTKEELNAFKNKYYPNQLDENPTTFDDIEF